MAQRSHSLTTESNGPGFPGPPQKELERHGEYKQKSRGGGRHSCAKSLTMLRPRPASIAAAPRLKQPRTASIAAAPRLKASFSLLKQRRAAAKSRHSTPGSHYINKEQLQPYSAVQRLKAVKANQRHTATEV